MGKLLKKFPYPGYVLSVFGVNLFFILLVFLFQSKLPPVVPLYYGLPKGSEQLAPKLALTFPALLALMITAINIFFASVMDNQFLQKILLGVAGLITLLAGFTTIKIVFLVGSF